MDQTTKQKHRLFLSAYVILYGALLLLLNGCAHGLLQPLPIIPEPTAAKLTVVRSPEFLALGMHYIISVDGKEMFVMWTGEHATIPVAPGSRTISAKCSGAQWITAGDVVYITIEPRGDYYLWVYPAPGSCANIARLSKAAAEEMMKQTTLLELK